MKKDYLKGYYESNLHASINQEMIYDEEVPEPNNVVEKIHRKQAYEKLSIEAKEVIDLVIQTPAELIGVITTPTGKKTKTLIVKYLEKKWKSKFLVEHVVKEITAWIKNW